MHQDRSDDAIRSGRQLVESGRFDEAEAIYLKLLSVEPAQADALAFALRCAMARGDHAGVIGLIERAAGAGLRDAALFSLKAQAHLFLDDRAAALHAMQDSLQVEPGQFTLRLQLGGLQEETGDKQQALASYYRALRDAQHNGRWTRESTTEPQLRDPVKHAIAFVDAGRERLFREALEPFRKMHGAAALKRIDRCLDMYLEGMQGPFDHPVQKPTFLHVPGLSSAGFYPRELFPWMDELEAHAAEIREEALSVLGGNDLLEPFLVDGGETTGQLRNDQQGKASWDAFFFYRHGRRYDDNHARCPATSSLLKKLPLVHIREQAPEILFSVLTPGTHILPHTGVTNTRLVSHLALIVPPSCAIRVGGETREWNEGRGFVFDDTHEHEAWNHGAETRVVLIADVWNPLLSGIEREAFGALVEAIGDFRHTCGYFSDAQLMEQVRKRRAGAQSASARQNNM